MSNLGPDLMDLITRSPLAAERRVLQTLLDLGAQVVDASEGSLLVYDAERRDLVFAMTIGENQSLLGQRVPLDRGLTGLAAMTREVQIGAPTFQVGGKPGEAPSDGSPEAVIAAPMLVADDLVGVITAVSFKPGKRFNSRDADLFGRIGAIAGVVVQQRHQLGALEALRGDQGSTPAAAVNLRLGQALAGLPRVSPEKVDRLARVFTDLVALCTEDD